MPLKSLNDLFVHELKDIHSAERQITKALPKLARAATDPKLRKAFEGHLAETKQQIELLDKIFDSIDATPGRHICKAMQGLIEEGQELIEKEQDKADPAVFDAALIGAAQRVEHYEIAAYGCAVSYAEQLGLTKPAQILQQILNQESATNEKLTALAEGGINQAAQNSEGQQSMASGAQGGGSKPTGSSSKPAGSSSKSSGSSRSTSGSSKTAGKTQNSNSANLRSGGVTGKSGEPKSSREPSTKAISGRSHGNR